MTDLKAYEDRATQAEKQIEALNQKFTRISDLADGRIKSLETENAQLKQELAQLRTGGRSVAASVSQSDSSVPKGHTAYSWGVEDSLRNIPLDSTTSSSSAQNSSSSSSSSSSPSSASLDMEAARKLFESMQLQSKHETPFSKRASIKSIIARKDQGIGLIGQNLVVAGWAKTARVQGGGRFAFLELNDGSVFGNLQIVVAAEVDGFKDVEGASTGASFLVEGPLVKGLGKQPVELSATKVVLLGAAEARTYPLAKKQHTLEHLRSVAHLRPRTNTIGAVARVRNALAFATHLFFHSLGFVYVHTPLITGSDCEGAGEMFGVTTLLKANLQDVPVVPNTNKIDYSRDFFGKPTFLTVSGQLNGENYACGLTNIYTFGPTFRAEVSHTSRHLAEFWMIEPEMAFVDLAANIDYAEAYLKFVVSYAIEHCGEDLEFFEKQYEKGLVERLRHVLNSPFVRITYTKAIEILKESGKKFEIAPEWGLDLGTEHERYLTDEVFKQPVVVTDYPKEFKAFYMRMNDDGKTVAAMDVLVPKIGEVIGGSQREERLDKLTEQLRLRGLPQEPYESYLDLRRYGSVQHSGFGLGFERLVMFTTGIENIRDVIPFPRWPGHAEF